MVAYNKFQDFVEQLGKGVHQLHSGGHVLEIYLSDEQPLVGDTLKSDIAEITQQNGYPGGVADIDNDLSEAAGTASLTAGNDPMVYTASGGAFGTLQFVVLFNQTAASPLDALIGWWDYGSSISVNDTETFTVDWGATVLTIA